MKSNIQRACPFLGLVDLRRVMVEPHRARVGDAAFVDQVGRVGRALGRVVIVTAQRPDLIIHRGQDDIPA